MPHPRAGSYRDLLVWQKARSLTVVIYALSASLPPAERYGLTAQVRRAVVSVSCNIAEGWGRGTRAEFRRHVLIARGSLHEVSSILDLAVDLGFLVGADVDAAHQQIDELGRMLTGLVRSLGAEKGVGR